MRLCALALIGAIAFAARAGEPITEANDTAVTLRDMTLDEVDELLANTRAAMWMPAPSAGNPRPEASGATFEKDLAKYVFTDASLARINNLRNELAKSTSGGSAIIRSTALEPLGRLLSVENCRATRIMMYWQMRQVRAYHEDTIQTLIERTQPADREAFTARLAALASSSAASRPTMESRVADCEADPLQQWARNSRSADDVKEMQEYNKLRHEIAGGPTPRDENGLPRAYVRRSTSCPPPVPPSGPQYRVVSRKDVSDFYPPAALMNEIEGRVVVLVVFEATGCVAVVAIKESSGSEMLDNAAVQYGFGIVFQPGEDKGKPMGGMVSVPVIFRLNN